MTFKAKETAVIVKPRSEGQLCAITQLHNKRYPNLVLMTTSFILTQTWTKKYMYSLKRTFKGKETAVVIERPAKAYPRNAARPSNRASCRELVIYTQTWCIFRPPLQAIHINNQVFGRVRRGSDPSPPCLLASRTACPFHRQHRRSMGPRSWVAKVRGLGYFCYSPGTMETVPCFTIFRLQLSSLMVVCPSFYLVDGY